MVCLECGRMIELGTKFCPHCGKETPLNNENNVGTITVVREKKMFGWAIPFDVYIDDTKLGTLKNGTTLTTKAILCPHEIKLTSTEKDVIQSIELTENKKEVVISIIPKMGLIAAKPYIKDIKYN
ncbi:MAG: zinc-ribbon domain-containing protein [Bacilli bacterium]